MLLKSGNKPVQNDLDWASLVLAGSCKPVTKLGSVRAGMQLKSDPKSFGNPFMLFLSINWAGAEQFLPAAPGAGVCPYLLGVCVLVSDLLMEPLAFPGVHQEGRSPHRVPGVRFLQGSVCLRGQQELLRVPGGHLPELSQRLQAWGKVTRLCFTFGGALGERGRQRGQGGKGKRSEILNLNCCRDEEGKQSLATSSARWVWLSPCGVISKPKP